MKKLLSVVAVAAIVTSAFAFNTTAQAFCVKQNGVCTIIRDKVIDNAGQPFTHFPLGAGQWNGTQAGCVNASPVTDCIVNVKLLGN